MKLDKIQFAHVIAHCVNNGMSNGEYAINELDRLIDVPVPVSDPSMVSPEAVDELLRFMVEGKEKIKAIKAYRVLTNAGLKEAKEAVERYWEKTINTNYLIMKIDKQLYERDMEIPSIDEYILNDFTNEQLEIIKNFIQSF